MSHMVVCTISGRKPILGKTEEAEELREQVNELMRIFFEESSAKAISLTVIRDQE